MTTQQLLPAIDAALNLIATTLLVLGYRAVKRGDVERHKRLMVSALVVSACFLVVYLTYHLSYPPMRFGGAGIVKGVYLFVLLTHIPLAAIVPVLALRTAWLGWKGRVEAHRRWAKVTFPIWMYVSVTGVLVYVMLHLLWPGPVGE